MSGWAAFAFVLSTAQPPLDTALKATEAPKTLRAAFTIEVRSDDVLRVVRFDPREMQGAMWTTLESRGRDQDVDAILTSWRADPSADSMLFPDNLRARLGATVEVEDLGQAWAMDFRPAITASDSSFDIQASEHLAGVIWLEPETGRIVRVEYKAERPFNVNGLGRVDRLNQTYVMSYDEALGISFISAMTMDFAGSRGPVSRSRSIQVRLVDVNFFFASPEAAAEWRKDAAGKADAVASSR